MAQVTIPCTRRTLDEEVVRRGSSRVRKFVHSNGSDLLRRLPGNALYGQKGNWQNVGSRFSHFVYDRGDRRHRHRGYEPFHVAWHISDGTAHDDPDHYFVHCDEKPENTASIRRQAEHHCSEW
ncbi:hypothetical protein D3C84_843990 [compost metagenome]